MALLRGSYVLLYVRWLAMIFWCSLRSKLILAEGAVVCSCGFFQS